MRTNKQLRDFVRSHEVRYLVFIDRCIYGYAIGVKRVYKVDVEGHTQWVRFSYGTPYIVGEDDVKLNLFKTRKEAEERAEAMRMVREAKKKKEAEERKKILDKAASILHDNYSCMTDKNNKLKDEYKKIYAEAAKMVQRYGYEPDKSEQLRQYVKRLERYVRTGAIALDAGTTITKASVIRIDKYYNVTLTDGTVIAPKDDDVIDLLRAIFGVN